MANGRARVAASVLDADLSNLGNAVRRLQAAGSDRIHLDVMDAHFVPNLTFGPRTIKAIRRRTELPLDAHLMVSEPGRYLDEYLDAGCDSITIHVEIDEPIEPTLRAIRAAGRNAGLALKPATPLTALAPYQHLLDIVMIMTVEPGFGGQSFMKDVAKEKLLAARDYLAHKPHGAEVHVDGGINRETAEFVGALGVDILVVGSALFVKGHDMGREIRLIRALADEGYQFGLNDGVPPIPRDRMVRFASLPKHLAKPLSDDIEAGGIPVIMLRGEGQVNPDGVRDYDLLVPATTESLVHDRHDAARDAALQAADAWRSAYAATPDADSASQVRALLQRTTCAEVRVDGEIVGSIGPGLVILLGVGPADTAQVAADLARRVTELRVFRDDEGRTNLSLTDIGGAVLAISQFTLYADTRRGRRPGFTGAAAPDLAEDLYRQFVAALRALDVTVETGRFGAEMAVELVNDGPFTIWLDTDDR